MRCRLHITHVSGQVLSVPTCTLSPYMVHGMSLRTQIPTLAGLVGTRHTTTKTHGERRKNSITPWQKRWQQAVCAVLRAHAKGPGSWRPLRGRGQLAGRTDCAASMGTKMDAWTSSQRRAAAQPRRASAAGDYQVHHGARAQRTSSSFPDSFSHLIITAASLTSSSTCSQGSRWGVRKGGAESREEWPNNRENIHPVDHPG